MKKTLIVLMLRAVQGVVVLAAFALIATVVSASGLFQGRSECGGRVGAGQADLISLSCALSMYEVDHAEYPTTEQGLQALAARPTDPASMNWKGPYLDHREVTKDPWGSDYVYRRLGTGYELFSPGPDGIAGTADDVRRP